jgi:hypothetical protein
MNKRINPVWAGIAVAGIFLIAILAYTGWNFGVLLNPAVLGAFAFLVLFIVLGVVEHERSSKIHQFLKKYYIYTGMRIAAIIVGLIYVIAILL